MKSLKASVFTAGMFLAAATQVQSETEIHFAYVDNGREQFLEQPVLRHEAAEAALYAETDLERLLRLEYTLDGQIEAASEFLLPPGQLVRFPASSENFSFQAPGLHTLRVMDGTEKIFEGSIFISKSLAVEVVHEQGKPKSDWEEIQPPYSPDTTTKKIVSLNKDVFSNLRSTGSAVYEKIAPSVTLITAQNSLGSGITLNTEGLTLTNYHVVEGNQVVTVRYKPATIFEDISAESYVADVLYTDETRDLALIQLRTPPPGLQPIALGKLEDIRVGLDVHAIGHPLGNVWSYTRGYISQFRPKHEWNTRIGAHAADVIQTQTPINPGNSGGPLLSDEGHLLGVNTFGDADPSSQGLNFAVSITSVEDFLQQASAASKTNTNAEQFYSNATKLDKNEDGLVDRILYDDDRNNVAERIEADVNFDGWFDLILLDDNQNQTWDLIVELIQGPPKFAVYRFDENEDDIVDAVGYDYDMDGKIDMFE